MPARRACAVKAGQVYRAKARRGYKLVIVERVRGLARGSPYAWVHLILPSGKRPSGAWIAGGWYLGQKGDSFAIQLTWAATRWAMPPKYELR